MYRNSKYSKIFNVTGFSPITNLVSKSKETVKTQDLVTKKEFSGAGQYQQDHTAFLFKDCISGNMLTISVK